MTRIVNRDYQHPKDGWYHIEATGEHPNQASGVVQVVDSECVSLVVNRFNQEADAGTLRHGHEMLVDHEHFAADTDKESRAYGWLQRLQARADGIYAKIRWTNTGKAAVDGGDYRFFSTEYAPSDVRVLNTGSGMQRVRPLRLDGLSLTNMNNNRGQKPITNRGNAADAGTVEGCDEAQITEASFHRALVGAIQRETTRVQRDQGCDFHTAWGIVQNEKPKFFDALLGNNPIANRSGAAQPAPRAETPHERRTVIVNRVQRERKCDFKTAWGVAREENPALFNVTPGVTFSNRPQPKEALNTICNRIRRELGCDFSTAWTVARARHPEEFGCHQGSAA